MPVSTVAPYPSVSPYPNYSRDDAGVIPKKDDPAYPAKKDDSGEVKGGGKKQITPEQEKEVEKLKKRDAQVRAHEAAHVAAGGAYIKGGATFSYEKGPDGVMYAVGGEVSIDTSPVRNDPRATIAKMETVKAAALAPADPSGADRAVASAAQQEEVKAQQELSQQKSTTSTGDAGKSKPKGSQNKSDPTSSYSAKGEKTANVNITAQLVNIIA